jgi:hypothetical protein
MFPQPIGWGRARSWPAGRDPTVLTGEWLDPGRGGARSRLFWPGNDQIPTSRLGSGCFGWRTGHRDVAGGLVIGGIRWRVAKQVVGLKPIGLFENEKY